MADEEKPAEGAASEEGNSGPKPSKGPLLLVLVNTIAIVLALGTFVYTKMLYKRPQIVEWEEKERVEDRFKGKNTEGTAGTFPMEKFTVNLKPSLPSPEPIPGTYPTRPKIHYCHVQMSLELRDISLQPKVEESMTIIKDKIIHLFSKKSYQEITNIQGRYILRTEMIRIINDVLKEPLVSNIFFTQLIVQ